MDNTATRKSHEILKREYVEAALLADKGPEAKLLSWTTEDFCKHGDNFATYVTSIQCKALINGNEEDLSYIAKLNPCHNSEAYATFIPTVFKHEITYFQELAPLLSEYLPKSEPLNIPKCFIGSAEAGNEYLIANDLRKDNFKMVDKKFGLGLRHCELVIKELARMHATSWILLSSKSDEQFKEEFPALSQDIMDDGPESAGYQMFETLLHSQIDMAVSFIHDEPKYKNVVDWLMNLKPNVMEALKGEIVAVTDKFKAITHGDCWSNNFLFKYNELDEPIEVCLVDLQMCRVSSLATDLNHCIYASTVGPLRQKHLPELISAYFKKYQEVIKGAKLEMPFTYEELQKEINDKITLGFIMGIIVGPMVIIDSSDIPKFDNVEDGDFGNVFAKMMDNIKPKLKQNDQYEPRFLGLMDDIKAHIENNNENTKAAS